MSPRSEVFNASLFLGVCLFAVVWTALDQRWDVSAIFGGLALVGAGMLWAARRRLQRGRRDVPAMVATVGVILIVLLTLTVLSLIK